ncbi:MAG: hypothetical protein H6737_15245 [Alphaproteobacteria bacterium]|nr:hypothetical protein [Alphaproteobacteria bacterium]
MIWGLLLLPTLLAGGLALYGRAHHAWMLPVRVVAVGSAVLVVLLELLPASVAALGIWALVVAVLAFTAPWVVERLAGDAAQSGWAAVGVVAVHQMADGAQMGVVGTDSPAVLAVLALHGAPLVATAVLGAADQGRTAGVLALALLTAGLTTGMALGQVAVPVLAPIEPWLQAGIGGLLLHVFGHDVAAALTKRKAVEA